MQNATKITLESHNNFEIDEKHIFILQSFRHFGISSFASEYLPKLVWYYERGTGFTKAPQQTSGYLARASMFTCIYALKKFKGCQ